MITSVTHCGCGAEIVVKASEVDGELVVQVRSTGQYQEKRESLRSRIQRSAEIPEPRRSELNRRFDQATEEAHQHSTYHRPD